MRGEAGKRLVDRALEELSYVWTDPSPFNAASKAIEKLLPGSTVYFYKWGGEEYKEVYHLGASNSIDCEKSPWIQSGDALSMRPFNPSKPCPVGNLAFNVEFIGKSNPKEFAVFIETFMNHFGFGPYGEAILYKGKDYLACLAFGREKGSRSYSSVDLARIQDLIPVMNESINARKTLTSKELSPGNVVLIAEAIDTPAFIATTNGIVIHANKKAMAAYPRYPDWMKACCSERRGVKRPSWVKRVPIRIGELSLWLLLPERLVTDFEDAPRSHWARYWKLQPRHARVAALLMQGLSDKEIADRLGLSHGTIRTYVKELFLLARVHSRHELVSAAMRL